MTDNIEPALSAAEAEAIAHDGALTGGLTLDYDVTYRDGEDLRRRSVHRNLDTHGAIAALNAALPDSDPRKITPEWVAAIRSEANELKAWCSDAETDAEREDMLDRCLRLIRIAEVLESYLPPESA